MYEIIDKVLISEEQIKNRISEIAGRLNKDYEGLNPIIICILKGSLYFTSDLLKNLTIPVTLDFMSVSSYGEATHTSGIVKIIKDLDENIKGRHVLIIEDIIDTGLTLNYLTENLHLRMPKDIKICTLLDKKINRTREILIHYAGFEIENHFVIGYGLDYMDKYRHIPFIGTLRPDLIDK